MDGWMCTIGHYLGKEHRMRSNAPMVKKSMWQ